MYLLHRYWSLLEINWPFSSFLAYLKFNTPIITFKHNIIENEIVKLLKYVIQNTIFSIEKRHN